jgi:tRNA(Ile)-lysidine synthase
MRPGYVDDGVRFERPLLDITRAQTEAACRAEGIDFWTDPHNADPRFLRARVRHDVLPVLERELGPGVAETLARTAGQVRDDIEALDAIAAATHALLKAPDGLALRLLNAEPRAIASRVLRLAAIEAGAIDAELFHVHVTALVDLAVGNLRGEVQLPGHVTAYLGDGHLRFRRTQAH